MTHRSIDFIAALGLISMLFLMLVPLPTWLVSFLVVLNLSLSVVVLLITTYIQQALEFSVFPTLLLGLTLFRMSLSVASTKLILLQGDAGSVIQAFGEVVVRGNPVVGFVVFLILVVVQFIVITKGAERVSEVAARFTLDAMPGKQMAVDAELNAGLIDEKQARLRREVIEKEADFYGSMDGASKFVRGDAIASMIIVAVNLIGGISVGFLQKKMEWGEILSTFTILTIGDGLAHQIPALIVSTAAGILVTRTGSSASLGQDLMQQFSLNPRALSIGSGIVFSFALLGMMSGLPSIPFLAVAGLLLMAANAVIRKQKQTALELAKASPSKEKENPKNPEDVTPLLTIETLEVELGYGLLYLVDASKGEELLERIAHIRRNVAKELGLVVPPVRIRDSVMLPANTYAIKIRNLEVARGELMPKQLMAMGSGSETSPLQGIETKEPAFGLPAVWIKDSDRRGAELAGYTVVDTPSVLATHLTEIIKSHAHEFLGRQEVQALLSDLKSKGYTAILEELSPQVLGIGAVQKVLQSLLRERISIRNLLTILEATADAAAVSKEPDHLTEHVRTVLGRQITRSYVDADGVLHAVTLAPPLERQLLDSLHKTERGVRLLLEPPRSEQLMHALAQKVQEATGQGISPVVLCSASLRPHLQRQAEHVLKPAVVLSFSEVPADIHIRSLGSLTLGDEPLVKELLP